VLLAHGVQAFFYPIGSCDGESFEILGKGKKTIISSVPVA
jgi:hypothetical protein